MKKPVWQTGSFRSRRVRALFDRVTGPKRDPATETPFQSSGIQSHSSSKIRLEPVTNGLCQWRISVSARLGIMSCRRVGCRGRPRRGIPHMAKRTTAHHSLLRLASVGLCNSGTGKPTAPLKKREAACPKGRPNQQSSRTGCVSGARGR